MKFFSPKFRLLLPALMLALTLFLFAGNGGYATLFTTTAKSDTPDFDRTENPTRHFAPPPRKP